MWARRKAERKRKVERRRRNKEIKDRGGAARGGGELCFR